MFVGNKAKGRISKRVFQENKAHQIFRKRNISYPLIRTRTSEITPDSNQEIVNDLDVTLNSDGISRPYHKPDDKIQYMHTESSHPPNITKHTSLIENRLLNLSSKESSTIHYKGNLQVIFF